MLPIWECPELITVVAQWLFDEWGHIEPDGSLDHLVAGLRHQAASPDAIATTFVALDGTLPVGMAGVVEQTAEVYRASPRQRDLSPWLGSVYVPPEHRGRGIASALVRHAMAHVWARGISRFYLFTDGAQGLYERCGWQAIGVDRYAGRSMTIMAVDVSPSTDVTNP
jgi:GNAT superfamily N-acetyltransferase